MSLKKHLALVLVWGKQSARVDSLGVHADEKRANSHENECSALVRLDRPRVSGEYEVKKTNEPPHEVHHMSVMIAYCPTHKI